MTLEKILLRAALELAHFCLHDGSSISSRFVEQQ